MFGAARKVMLNAPIRQMSLSKKQIELATRWAPSAGVFGLSAAIAGLYFTDWRLIVDWIPFYNTKFPAEPTE